MRLRDWDGWYAGWAGSSELEQFRMGKGMEGVVWIPNLACRSKGREQDTPNCFAFPLVPFLAL